MPLPRTAPAEVVIGRIVRVGDDGAPVVDFAGNPAGEPVRAMATARYDDVSPGASVALMFVEGDRARPLAIGVIAHRAGAGGPAAALEERLTFHRGARDRAAMRPRQPGADPRRQGAGARRLCVAALVGHAAHHRRLRADQLTKLPRDEPAQRNPAWRPDTRWVWTRPATNTLWWWLRAHSPSRSRARRRDLQMSRCRWWMPTCSPASPAARRRWWSATTCWRSRAAMCC